MIKTLPIKEDRLFRQLYKKGNGLAFPSIVVYYRKNRLNTNQLGLTTTKKIGKAVRRNRARRLMREAYRIIEPEMKSGYDMVLVARSKTPFLTMGEVKNDLSAAFKKAGIIGCSENNI